MNEKPPLPIESVRHVVEFYYIIQTILDPETKFWESFSAFIEDNPKMTSEAKEFLPEMIQDTEREFFVLFRMFKASLECICIHGEDEQVLSMISTFVNTINSYKSPIHDLFPFPVVFVLNWFNSTWVEDEVNRKHVMEMYNRIILYKKIQEEMKMNKKQELETDEER